MLKSIKFKMIILGGIPLTVAIVFMLSSIRAKYKTVKEMNAMLRLSQLAVKMSALVHETQKERGRTAVFMGSDGTTFVTELTRQRQQTDASRAELEQFLETLDLDTYSKEFREVSNKAAKAKERLEEHRARVSNQSIPDAQGIAFYTQLNGLMLDVIQVISEISPQADLARLGAAYVNFLQDKERAGLERAVMSKTFASDRFAEGDLKLFGAQVNNQETYFEVFRSLAAPEQLAFFDQKLSDPVVAEVQRMRDMAFSRGFTTAKSKLFVTLVTSLGYGGTIHNYKNLVLRNIPKYREGFEKNYEEIIHILDQIETLSETIDKEKEHIQVIRNTIIEYRTAIATAAEMLRVGKTVAEIDDRVKIDDSPALEAIEKLAVTLDAKNFGVDAEYWFSSMVKKINLMKDIETRLSDDLSHQASALKADARNALIFISSVVGLVVIAVLTTMSLITRSITRPVDSIVLIAEAIADGDLSKKIDIRRKDELGKLAEAFRSMQNTIRKVSQEINGLSRNIQDGRLDVRGNPKTFDGDWRDLVVGMNNVIDAFMTPFNVTAEYLDRIAKGDIPEKIREEYKGDFVEVINNLNQGIDAITGLVAETGKLTEAAVEGRLDVRGRCATSAAIMPRLSVGSIIRLPLWWGISNGFRCQW